MAPSGDPGASQERRGDLKLVESFLVMGTFLGRWAVALRPWQTGAIFVGIPLALFLLISAAVLMTTRHSPDRDPAEPVLGTPTLKQPDADAAVDEAAQDEGSRSDDDTAG